MKKNYRIKFKKAVNSKRINSYPSFFCLLKVVDNYVWYFSSKRFFNWWFWFCPWDVHMAVRLFHLHAIFGLFFLPEASFFLVFGFSFPLFSSSSPLSILCLQVFSFHITLSEFLLLTILSFSSCSLMPKIALSNGQSFAF